MKFSGVMTLPKHRQIKPQAAAWDDSRVLFEDDWLIAVDKPAGLPTQPTLDASRPSLLSVLKGYMTARDGREPYLGLHHRLDRDTSGVVLFTKDPRANAGVGALFAEKKAQKTYQALAELGAGCPETWEIKNHLGVVGREAKAAKYGAVRSGGDPAHTSFRELGRFHEVVHVEAMPHTGRTHQIRVHLAGCGHPILGDAFYGGLMAIRLGSGARLCFPRMMLHAAALEFTHPMTQQAIRIDGPLPGDFARSLAQLSA